MQLRRGCYELRCLQDVCLQPGRMPKLVSLPALAALRVQLPAEVRAQSATQLLRPFAALTNCRSLHSLAIGHADCTLSDAMRGALRVSERSLQALLPLMTQLDSFALENGQWVLKSSAANGMEAIEQLLGTCKMLRLEIQLPTLWRRDEMGGACLSNLHSLELMNSKRRSDYSVCPHPCRCD